VSISILFGLLALFGPAIAAIVVTRAEGTSQRVGRGRSAGSKRSIPRVAGSPNTSDGMRRKTLHQRALGVSERWSAAPAHMVE
jgi:hypothetical protein